MIHGNPASASLDLILQLALKLLPWDSWYKHMGVAWMKTVLCNDHAARGADTLNLHTLGENIATDCP